MNVRDLRDLLRECDEEAEVFIYNASSEDDAKVEKVETYKSFDETHYVKGDSAMNPKYCPKLQFPVVCILGS